MYNASTELAALEEDVSLVRMLVESVDELRNDNISTTAIRSLWWRLDSKVREVEEFIRADFRTDKDAPAAVNGIELDDLERQDNSPILASGTSSANRWGWYKHTSKVLEFKSQIKELRKLLSFGLLGFTSSTALKTQKMVSSLMAPHQIVPLAPVPQLAQSQLLHQVHQLDMSHLEKTFEEVRIMRQHQEGFGLQLQALGVVTVSVSGSTAEGENAGSSPATFASGGSQSSIMTHHPRNILPFQVAPENYELYGNHNKWYLNNVSPETDNGGGENRSSKGWERLTMTFIDGPAMANIGLPTRTWRDRDKVISCFMQAISGPLSSLPLLGSATNFEIGQDETSFFSRLAEDHESTIDYPKLSDCAHVKVPCFRDMDLVVHHWAGWVYVVSYQGVQYVKKEIPMQAQVDSFNYELDALGRLQGSPHVLKLYGVVTDNTGLPVKGMLVQDLRPLEVVIRCDSSHLSWHQKEKWAKQILYALADIHAEGIVMGEVNYAQFGLTMNDDIKVMGIKRRGCPVGWQTPEYLEIVPHDISTGIFGPQVMRMGQKTDMYQAGLLLWTLAVEEFPETQEQNVLPPIPSNVPRFYRKIVEICLNKEYRNRKTAAELLKHFDSREIRPGEILARPFAMFSIGSQL